LTRSFYSFFFIFRATKTHAVVERCPMFKFSYDNGRVTKSLVRWVREATLINIPLYRLGVGLLTFLGGFGLK